MINIVFIRHQALCFALAALAWHFPAATSAQNYPTKPVRYLVPFPAAASPDIVARHIAAAQSGVMVAQLRAAGVQGPPAILEGPMGFCKVMAPKCDVERLTRGLGQDYEFGKVTIKIYPTSRFVHGPTETAIALKRAHRIDAGAIREVTVETFNQSIEVSSRPQLNTSFDDVVSHQYSVALALVKEQVALSDITGYENGDARALALMKKVRVLHSDSLEKDFPRSWPHRVSAHMNDGRSHVQLSEYPPGRVTPIASDAVDDKFLSQCAPYLGDARAKRALGLLRDVAGCRNLRVVAEALV